MKTTSRLQGFRLFLAVILTAVFILSSFYWICYAGIHRSVDRALESFASPGHITDAIYPQLIHQIAQDEEGFMQGFNKGLGIFLTENQKERILELIIPRTWVEEQVRALSSQALGFITLKQDTLSLAFHTGALAERFKPENNLALTEEILQVFPPCDNQALFNMLAAIASGNLQGMICQPAPDKAGPITLIIRLALESMQAVFPDSIQVVNLSYTSIKSQMPVLGVYERLYRLISLYTPWIKLAAGASLVLLILCTAVSLKSVLGWTGTGAFLTGGVSVFVAKLAGQVLPKFAGEVKETGTPAETIMAYITNAGHEMLVMIRTEIEHIGLLVLLAGAVLLIASLLMRRGKTP